MGKHAFVLFIKSIGVILRRRQISNMEQKENAKKKVILLSIDIEATGLSKFKDTTVELGIDIVLMETDGKTLFLLEELPSFQKYSCGREGIQIGDEAAKITGLSKDFLRCQHPLNNLFLECVEHIHTVCAPLRGKNY
jgi:hypothetical protein